MPMPRYASTKHISEDLSAAEASFCSLYSKGTISESSLEAFYTKVKALYTLTKDKPESDSKAKAMAFVGASFAWLADRDDLPSGISRSTLATAVSKIEKSYASDKTYLDCYADVLNASIGTDKDGNASVLLKPADIETLVEFEHDVLKNGSTKSYSIEFTPAEAEIFVTQVLANLTLVSVTPTEPQPEVYLQKVEFTGVGKQASGIEEPAIDPTEIINSLGATETSLSETDVAFTHKALSDLTQAEIISRAKTLGIDIYDKDNKPISAYTTQATLSDGTDNPAYTGEGQFDAVRIFALAPGGDGFRSLSVDQDAAAMGSDEALNVAAITMTVKSPQSCAWTNESFTEEGLGTTLVKTGNGIYGLSTFYMGDSAAAATTPEEKARLMAEQIVAFLKTDQAEALRNAIYSGIASIEKLGDDTYDAEQIKNAYMRARLGAAAVSWWFVYAGEKELELESLKYTASIAQPRAYTADKINSLKENIATAYPKGLADQSVNLEGIEFTATRDDVMEAWGGYLDSISEEDPEAEGAFRPTQTYLYEVTYLCNLQFGILQAYSDCFEYLSEPDSEEAAKGIKEISDKILKAYGVDLKIDLADKRTAQKIVESYLIWNMIIKDGTIAYNKENDADWYSTVGPNKSLTYDEIKSMIPITIPATAKGKTGYNTLLGKTGDFDPFIQSPVWTKVTDLAKTNDTVKEIVAVIKPLTARYNSEVAKAITTFKPWNEGFSGVIEKIWGGTAWQRASMISYETIPSIKVNFSEAEYAYEYSGEKGTVQVKEVTAVVQAGTVSTLGGELARQPYLFTGDVKFRVFTDEGAELTQLPEGSSEDDLVRGEWKNGAYVPGNFLVTMTGADSESSWYSIKFKPDAGETEEMRDPFNKAYANAPLFSAAVGKDAEATGDSFKAAQDAFNIMYSQELAITLGEADLETLMVKGKSVVAKVGDLTYVVQNIDGTQLVTHLQLSESQDFEIIAEATDPKVKNADTGQVLASDAAKASYTSVYKIPWQESPTTDIVPAGTYVPIDRWSSKLPEQFFAITQFDKLGTPDLTDLLGENNCTLWGDFYTEAFKPIINDANGVPTYGSLVHTQQYIAANWGTLYDTISASGLLAAWNSYDGQPLYNTDGAWGTGTDLASFGEDLKSCTTLDDYNNLFASINKNHPLGYFLLMLEGKTPEDIVGENGGAIVKNWASFKLGYRFAPLVTKSTSTTDAVTQKTTVIPKQYVQIGLIVPTAETSKKTYKPLSLEETESASGAGLEAAYCFVDSKTWIALGISEKKVKTTIYPAGTTQDDLKVVYPAVWVTEPSIAVGKVWELRKLIKSSNSALLNTVKKVDITTTYRENFYTLSSDNKLLHGAIIGIEGKYNTDNKKFTPKASFTFAPTDKNLKLLFASRPGGTPNWAADFGGVLKLTDKLNAEFGVGRADANGEITTTLHLGFFYNFGDGSQLWETGTFGQSKRKF